MPKDISQQLAQQTYDQLARLETQERRATNVRSRVWKNPQGYRYLVQWSNNVLLRILIRQVTNALSRSEYRLKAQVNDASRSIIANIEEGYKRPTTKEYLTFLGYSQASLEEVKGDTERMIQDGFLQSVPDSSLLDLGIDLKKWSQWARRPGGLLEDFRGDYRSLEEIRGTRPGAITGSGAGGVGGIGATGGPTGAVTGTPGGVGGAEIKIRGTRPEITRIGPVRTDPRSLGERRIEPGSLEEIRGTESETVTGAAGAAGGPTAAGGKTVGAVGAVSGVGRRAGATGGPGGVDTTDAGTGTTAAGASAATSPAATTTAAAGASAGTDTAAGRPLTSSNNPLTSSNPPLNSSKILYFPLEKNRGNYRMLKDIRGKDITYEMLIELINKTDFVLRRLVRSLEQKQDRDEFEKKRRIMRNYGY